MPPFRSDNGAHLKKTGNMVVGWLTQSLYDALKSYGLHPLCLPNLHSGAIASEERSGCFKEEKADNNKLLL